MSTRTKFRCAVYTRKSTEEGLDQEFAFGLERALDGIERLVDARRADPSAKKAARTDARRDRDVRRTDARRRRGP